MKKYLKMERRLNVGCQLEVEKYYLVCNHFLTENQQKLQFWSQQGPGNQLVTM